MKYSVGESDSMLELRIENQRELKLLHCCLNLSLNPLLNNCIVLHLIVLRAAAWNLDQMELLSMFPSPPTINLFIIYSDVLLSSTPQVTSEYSDFNYEKFLKNFGKFYKPCPIILIAYWKFLLNSGNFLKMQLSKKIYEN